MNTNSALYHPVLAGPSAIWALLARGHTVSLFRMYVWRVVIRATWLPFIFLYGRFHHYQSNSPALFTLSVTGYSTLLFGVLQKVFTRFISKCVSVCKMNGVGEIDSTSVLILSLNMSAFFFFFFYVTGGTCCKDISLFGVIIEESIPKLCLRERLYITSRNFLPFWTLPSHVTHRHVKLHPSPPTCH